MAKRLGTTVAIVGAGVGGLAAAARLAAAGFDVRVFERGTAPGGRCGRVTLGPFRFDLGPTLLLMPEVLEETFAAVGHRMDDHLRLTRCDPNYRLHFPDGSHATFTSELTTMGRQLERLEPGSFIRYLEFLARGHVQYTASLERFVGRNFDHLGQFFTPANLVSVLRVRAHRKMYAEVSRYFADERLRAALSFQTMYLGISPFDAPAVYGLLPFTELAHGIWYPDGGLHEIPRALARIAEDLGASIHYDAAVRRIDVEGGRATGCTLADGRRIAADVVLCNADLPWAYRNLISPDASRLRGADRLRYTSSAYMMYLGTRQAFPALVHHNVFFGRDYRGSFEDLFRHHRVPADPSFYVNVAARTDVSVAPAGRDGVYVLVPVPHRDARLDWKAEGAKLRAHVLTRLAACGADLHQAIEVERHVTPDDWAADLNLERGAAFGLSHDFFQVGVFRPANQDPRVRNLFFVGASTQPGTGLPMVLLSARLATERILAICGVPERARASARHAA